MSEVQIHRQAVITATGGSGYLDCVSKADYDQLLADLREWMGNSERLREILNAHEPSMKAALEEVAALTAERDALKADAERYRWLREVAPIHIASVAWVFPQACEFGDADAAIDAAIKGK